MFQTSILRPKYWSYSSKFSDLKVAEKYFMLFSKTVKLYLKYTGLDILKHFFEMGVKT